MATKGGGLSEAEGWRMAFAIIRPARENHRWEGLGTRNYSLHSLRRAIEISPFLTAILAFRLPQPLSSLVLTFR
jgi:hypothetical protein